MPINIYSIQPICVSVYVDACIFECVCVCVCVYVYRFVCICVCVALSIVCNSAGAQSVRGATTISGPNCSVEPCMKLFCGSV